MHGCNSVMNLKTLAKQHDEFAARQARKAERDRLKAEQAAAKTARWTLMKETWRRTQERKERARDAAQQRRLEESDAVYTEGGNAV